MKERKRKHDDAHYPMQGKNGRRANKAAKLLDKFLPKCPSCGKFPDGFAHLCTGELDSQHEPKKETK